MKAQIAALVVLAGAVSAANAAPKLVWQVSTDNGATWGAARSATAGSTVKVRGMVDWTGTTGYGFGGLTHQIFIDNYLGTDGGAQIASNGVGNRVGPFNFGAATLSARVTGSTQRIVALGTTGNEGNISSGQQAPASAGGAYSTANPALIFTFDYVLGADASARTLTIRSVVAASSGVNSSFGFHAAASSTSTSFRESGTVENATITIIPTPGALAVLGLGGLVAGRRRRA
ncbi:MAG: MYXO-CTERM sorting domain-containing protein [Planctomycetota bacterium]|nr:MYXO-CTERM sorting domain-containing protein [Planctomycetota bacterium]